MEALLTADEIRACPILYVDDEPDNLQGFKMTFRRRFSVTTASSGAEALAILRQQEVAVVVTDQRMPEMTGVELIAKAREIRPDTVYLILTAFSDFDAMVAGINTGALSGYLSKPWERAEVETILTTAIERHLLSRRLRERNAELAAINMQLEEKVLDRTAELEATVSRLNEANAQLAELNRLKDDFVAFCSHDLKSPLTALMGYLDLMEVRLARQPGMEVFAGTVSTMRTVVDEMTSLVLHILDLSRLQSGRDDIRPTVAPLERTLERALATMRPLAETKGVGVEVAPPCGLPPIEHDVERIQQVISNLLSNAIKFTKPGGRIEVSIHPGDGGRQVVEVADTGIGMKPEDAARVFTDGQSLRRPGTQGENSSGLGLTICHRLVAMHGGSTWATSTPGVGSVFGFELPPHPPAVSTGPPAASRQTMLA
ncbi:MAG: hybrid sensor histidine kinase/response regulator [Candidatus Sumerlaeia bacterium]|nr:hybrid sensor histidine kinase/response regulator [Candidatus Sumerlaeia bacterium]